MNQLLVAHTREEERENKKQVQIGIIPSWNHYIPSLEWYKIQKLIKEQNHIWLQT